jgi:polysaccharide export outer membrane protein
MQQRSIRAIGLPLLFIMVLLAASGLGARLSAPASAQAQTLAPAEPAASYVLGPNDRIRLKVYGESDITGEYEVDNSGNVSVPLAGHLKAAGLTTRELERSITSALSKESCAIRA